MSAAALSPQGQKAISGLNETVYSVNVTDVYAYPVLISAALSWNTDLQAFR